MPRSLLGVALLAAACVPADEALALGSVQFVFTATDLTVDGVPAERTSDRYALRFDRIALGFKTMTVGKIGAPDTCSYRGRGAITDAVFDPRVGLVQTFNGIQPVECPDVGVIFGRPEESTIPADGTPAEELVALAEDGLHAIVEATATPPRRFSDVEPEPYKITLRFDPFTTSTRFGGCREQAKGVRILARQRDVVSVRFAAEALFREGTSSSSEIKVAPFAQADGQGNNDRVVTMAELDALPLTAIVGGDFYQLPSDENPTSSRNASLGDFVRFLFRFSIRFRGPNGLCIGNPPGGG